MFRVIAFVAGVAAGVALLLFVIASMSVPTPAFAKAADGPPSPPQQESGRVFAHPDDLQGMTSLGDEDDPNDGSQMDLEGNEVTPALAKYRFDAQGNIYETHAPHTEVPHLGSPTL